MRSPTASGATPAAAGSLSLTASTRTCWERRWTSPPARTFLGAFLDRIDAINAAIRLFPGVHDFIEGQAAKRLVAVVTGVPQGEAERQLERLGLAPFLASVHGATRATPKHIHMKRFLEARAIQPADALFVGDSHADMREAELAGVPFVGIGTPDFFAAGAPRAVVPVLPDLAPLIDG